ncbi:MAG: hypothetical protein WC718_07725 [Phycisphaerales bacterium]
MRTFRITRWLGDLGDSPVKLMAAALLAIAATVFSMGVPHSGQSDVSARPPTSYLQEMHCTTEV